MTGFLTLRGIEKRYPTPSGEAIIVEGFELALSEHEFVSLIGHSGCGKSTVLSMVAGLVEPTAGEVVLDGERVLAPGPDRGMVFQAPCLFPWMTALDNVLLAVQQVHPRASRRKQRSIAASHLEQVGLQDVVERRAAELSGGMRQRVGLARAFALEPKVLLLDEPFGMLDALTRLELQDALVRVWQQHRMTALMVTHDVDEALLLSDRVVLMTSGPAATVGDLVPVEFARPRDRSRLMASAEYDALKDRLLGFLEDHRAPSTRSPDPAGKVPEAPLHASVSRA